MASDLPPWAITEEAFARWCESRGVDETDETFALFCEETE